MSVNKLNLFILPFRACCQFVVSQTNNYHTGKSQLTQQVMIAKTEQNSSRIRVINKGI